MMFNHHFPSNNVMVFHLTSSPHQSTQLWWVPGICWGANSPDHVSPISWGSRWDFGLGAHTR